jgi:ligand-binding sensor domain-containing protein
LRLPNELVIEVISRFFNSGLSDQEGQIWMTTYQSGVWKNDGDKLRHYKVQNASGGVLLISIYQDRDGTLWLGTDNDGVYTFNGGQFEKFDHHK